MRVVVHFQGERCELDVPDDRLVGAWRGPEGMNPADAPRAIADALESPIEYPALRQAVVPGDRVVIALGIDVPEPAATLASIASVLTSVGIDDLVVLTPDPPCDGIARALPAGVRLETHDPDDATALAYLATTRHGRRVYLNRMLTDADFVLPVGRLGFDPALGFAGPWGVIHPGLGSAEIRRAFHASTSNPGPSIEHPNHLLAESLEVCWLLGTHLQLGLLDGAEGLLAAVAGAGDPFRRGASAAVESAWGFRAPERAEVVVVGIGETEGELGVEAISRGLAAATRLVRRGGKIVLLSRASGPIGPSLQRVIDARDPTAATAALKGREADPDFGAASRVAAAVAWADVYLLSRLDPDVVEDVGMIPLDRPDEARRLTASADSCLVVSHADRVGASTAEDES
jgi:hypothetical protein